MENTVRLSEKSKKSIFWGATRKNFPKKIFVQGPKLAPKLKSDHLWLQLATKDFRFNGQKLPRRLF